MRITYKGCFMVAVKDYFIPACTASSIDKEFCKKLNK